jgi:hypothetical protein
MQSKGGEAMGEGLELSEAGPEEQRIADPRRAATLLREAQQQARRELRVNLPALYVAFGLTVFVGYGGIWLSVRGQHLYRGPTGGVLALLGLLVLFSVIVRAGLVGRAGMGIGGRTVRQWSILAFAGPAGTAALLLEAGALFHAGISRPVLGLLEFAAPMLSMGFLFLVSSAIRLDWSRFALGVWLLAVAAGGAWGGPVVALATYALGGCGGFLAVAAVEQARCRA